MVCVDTAARCVSFMSGDENTDHFLAAWAGSLINGPVADRIGRKLSINVAVVIFVIGSAIQCGAVNIPMLFTGKCTLHLGST
jgi:MFS family permease